MKLAEIWRYPVKSMTGHKISRTVLNPGLGIPFDRRWALARAGGAATDDGAWHSKKEFLVLVKEGRLAELQSHFDDATGRFSFRGPDGLHGEGNLASAEGRAAIAGGVAKHLGLSADEAPAMVEAKSLGYFDSRKGPVSILNLASHRTLENTMGQDLDPARFRMNLWVEGADAWAEADWVGKRVRVGQTVLHITEPTGRCKATHINPDTGDADAKILHALKDNFGHTQMGVYAEVVEGGPLQTGNDVEVLG